MKSSKAAPGSPHSKETLRQNRLRKKFARPSFLTQEAAMSRFNSNLDHVRVAAPCSADWDSMFGDDRVRFCGQCKLNVYNLSEMRRAEAELLVGRAEGRVCVRYFQRRDGSIITDNCPVGLRAIKRRLTRVANAIGSMIISF